MVETGERLKLLVDAVNEYAILLLSPDGTVMTWNPGAERLKGYSHGEIVGRNFANFYPAEDIEAGKPQRELEAAARDGVCVDDGWRVRKDGSRFWAHVVITALSDSDGEGVRGYAKVTRDDSAPRAARARADALHQANQALLEGAGVTDILGVVTRHARELVGAVSAWVATPDTAGGYTVRSVDGSPGPALGSVLSDRGLSRHAAVAGESALVDDLAAAFPEGDVFAGLGPALMVPIQAAERVSAVLVAAGPTDGPRFRAADLGFLEAFAAQAAVVLEYERRQEQAREHRVGLERERIATDLHEFVIAELFATGLLIEGGVTRTDDPELRARLLDAVDRLDDTIRRVRSTIFQISKIGKSPSAAE